MIFYFLWLLYTFLHIKGQNLSEKIWSCQELGYCDDKLGFEAIKWLHNQLDDDSSGDVDFTESNEFLRDELQYVNGHERHKAFHGNDNHISVDELWKSWKVSEVHNWTLDETITWLIYCVELPQYVDLFITHNINGTTLPRLTNYQYINSIGIKDAIHRQKLSLKAMDVVLFGPSKHHNYFKDVILVLSCVIAIGGLWFAFVQYKYSQTHLRKMLKDMDALQKAEEQLQELQKQLDKAKEEQQLVNSEKQSLEERLKTQLKKAGDNIAGMNNCIKDTSLLDANEYNRVYELEEELKDTKEKLNHALSKQKWLPPSELQLWLQLTHELESNHYNAKRQAAEMQLLYAKEGCEKLKKKRSSFLGSFRVAHGSSIDDVDNRILIAKNALSEITHDLKERLIRWQQIEMLCGFAIVNNRGRFNLEAELLSNSKIRYQNETGSLTRSSSNSNIQDHETVSMMSNSATHASNLSRFDRISTCYPEVGSMISLPAASGLHHRNQPCRALSFGGSDFEIDRDEDDNISKPIFSVGDSIIGNFGTFTNDYSNLTSSNRTIKSLDDHREGNRHKIQKLQNVSSDKSDFEEQYDSGVNGENKGYTEDKISSSSSGSDHNSSKKKNKLLSQLRKRRFKLRNGD